LLSVGCATATDCQARDAVDSGMSTSRVTPPAIDSGATLRDGAFRAAGSVGTVRHFPWRASANGGLILRLIRPEELRRDREGYAEAPKYAHCHLAESHYRFNRRFHLRSILQRFLRGAVFTLPTPDKAIPSVSTRKFANIDRCRGDR
jgi:hypothetical protein